MEIANDEIFQIVNLTHEEQKITATLAINQASSIFNGHFPGQPVVPGACMLQLVKDIIEKSLNNPLRLKKADNLKFINMITPDSIELQLELSYKLNEQEVNVVAKLTSIDAVCFKFQGVFIRL